MRVIPVRDQSGRIVDMVDPNVAAAVAQAEEQIEAAARPRQEPGVQPLDPEQQRSMAELLSGDRRAGASRQQQRSPGRLLAAQVVVGMLLAWFLVNLPWQPPSPSPPLPNPPSPRPTEPTTSYMGSTTTDALDPDTRLDRAVVAYSAPDGAVIGALEPGRPYTVTARLSTTWVQIDAMGGGLVWVHRDAVRIAPDLLAAAPDLATPTAIPPAALPPLTTTPRSVSLSQAPPTTTCTVDRVVAVVSSADREVWSCISLADALGILPQGRVIADHPAAAQAYLKEHRRQQTMVVRSLATPTP